MFTTVGDFNKWPLVEVLSNPSESIDYTLSQNNMAMKYPPFPEDVQHLALAVGVQRPPEWYVDDLAATTTKKTLHTTHTDQKLATFLYDFPIQIFIKQANPKKNSPPPKKKQQQQHLIRRCSPRTAICQGSCATSSILSHKCPCGTKST